MHNKTISATYLILILGILAALGPFSIDMYLPAFQRIAERFNTAESNVAFTLTSYFIGIALGQLYYGPLVDKYGRKKPLLIGLALYACAALACVYAPSIAAMAAFRFLQALGACAGMVASTAIISDVFEAHQRAKAFSSIMLVMGLAPLIAPSIGSFFLVHGDWYYVFYFLCFFSIGVWLLIYFVLPETSKYQHQNKLRFNEIARSYWGVLRNNSFLGFTLVGSLSMAVLFTYISAASYIFLTYYKVSQATFSLLFAINASGMISGSYLNGLFNQKFHYLKIAQVASGILLITALIIFIVVLTVPQVPYLFLVLSIFILLFCVGCINPNATAASLVPFTDKTGLASALGGALRMGLGAFVAALLGMFHNPSLALIFGLIVGLALLCNYFLKVTQKKTA